jgi:hypothetical protein
MRTAALAQGLARSCAFYFVGTLNWDPAVMDSKVGLPLHREVDRRAHGGCASPDSLHPPAQGRDFNVVQKREPYRRCSKHRSSCLCEASQPIAPLTRLAMDG